MNLDDIIKSTEQRVVSEEHNVNKIDWKAGVADATEMIKMGKNVVKAAQRRANLNVKDGKVSFVSARIAPWHKLGTVVNGVMNSAEAGERANLNGWNLQKLRQQIEWNGKLRFTGTYAIVRSDTGAILTYGKAVGERYEIVSNEECFDFMDEMIKGGAQYETAGALGKGEVVWMQAQMPPWAIKDDKMGTYITCKVAHDGSGAIHVFVSSVRAECQNTLRTSFAKRGNSFWFKHTKNVKSKIEKAKEALGLAEAEREKFKEVGEALANTRLDKPKSYFTNVLDKVVLSSVIDITVAGQKLTSKEVKSGEILNQILAVQDADERVKLQRQYDRGISKYGNLLKDILERHEQNYSEGEMAGTIWFGLNSVTESADHSLLWGGRKYGDEERFESVLNGTSHEVKQIALQTALEIK